ncbi:MAG: hypothetical protein NT094_00790, partial [Candidatus Staskawiczbacteria bacterium]|nr:hypothetical protein [Candidatus Staskawiczbacteria bacterium]
MDSELFKPDKFSKSDIIYETASVDAAEIATSILKKYFADIEIKSVKKLVGTEINSNNFKVVTKINQKE